MKVAVICDRCLRDYIIDIFAKHREGWEIASFPALKSVDNSSYRSFPVTYLTEDTLSKVDAVLIAVVSESRLAFALRCCRYRQPLFIVDPEALKAQTDFIEELNLDGGGVVRVPSVILRIIFGQTMSSGQTLLREQLDICMSMLGKTTKKLQTPPALDTEKECVQFAIISGINVVRMGKESGRISPYNAALLQTKWLLKQDAASVRIFGAVGTDLYGCAVLDEYERLTLDTSGVRLIERGMTGRQLLTNDENGTCKVISYTPGADDEYELAHDDLEMITKADIVIGSVNRKSRIHKLRQVKEHGGGFWLSVDTNITTSAETVKALLPGTDFVFMSGTETLLPSIQKLSESYESVLIVTLAEKGSVAYCRGKEYYTPAIPVRDIKSTGGCGDIYQAGFLYSYWKERDIQKAMQEGARASYEQLLSTGARPGMQP